MHLISACRSCSDSISDRWHRMPTRLLSPFVYRRHLPPSCQDRLTALSFVDWEQRENASSHIYVLPRARPFVAASYSKQKR